MANTVNVSLTDTFDQWRVKTNEVGTAIGDLDLLNLAGEAGEDTIVGTLNNLRNETDNQLVWIGSIGNLFGAGAYTNLVDAANANKADIDTLATTAGIDLLTNSLIGYNGPETSAVDIFNAHLADIQSNDGELATITSDLNTAEANIVALQGDVGTWANYTGPELDITDALNTIVAHMTQDPLEYVNVSGDTMSGKLVADGGIGATSSLELGAGVGTAVTIDTNQRIGIGTVPHTTHKIDVNGNVNATSLSVAGEDTDDRYIHNSSAGGTAEISAALNITGNTTITGDLTIGAETIFDSTSTFTETIQDIIGGMVVGNAESGGITVVYEDSDGTLDFIMNTASTDVSDWDEAVQDTVGAMVSTNTESGISVDYDDTNGKLNFNVNDPTLTVSGDITGSATMSNLGSTTINATLVDAAVKAIIDSGYIQGIISNEYVQDIVGAMLSGNVETNITATYDDTAGKVNLANDLQILDVNGTRVF